MSNNSEISYFKIGLFFFIGLSLVVIALLLFGSNKLFQKTVYIETYFEESVQGIAEGYPVKYRGLQIGYVKKIALTSEIYPQPNNGLSNQIHSRSIYVLLALTSKMFTHLSENEFKQLLQEQINAGLRVKITPQGITGTTYLELNYVDPKTNQVPLLAWNPKYLYIPSAPGTLTQLSDNLQHLFSELKDVDFKHLFENLNTLLTSLNQVSVKTDQLVGNVNKPVEQTLRNFQDVSENLRTLSQQLKLYPSQILFSGAPAPIDPSKL